MTGNMKKHNGQHTSMSLLRNRAIVDMTEIPDEGWFIASYEDHVGIISNGMSLFLRSRQMDLRSFDSLRFALPEHAASALLGYVGS
jgi:hypothetical protein